MDSFKRLIEIESEIKKLEDEKKNLGNQFSEELFGNIMKVEKVEILANLKPTKIYIPIFKAPKDYYMFSEKLYDESVCGRLKYSYDLMEEGGRLLKDLYYVEFIFNYESVTCKNKYDKIILFDAYVVSGVQQCEVDHNGERCFLDLKISKKELFSRIVSQEKLELEMVE